MRVMVTGAAGFVGAYVTHLAPASWELLTVSRSPLPLSRENVEHFRLDLHDEDAVERLFGQLWPDAVIHCAAVADIDFCQNQQAEADAINVGITERIARLCARHKSRLVHCSTDNVFDGARGMYAEDDIPNPVNFYGLTKFRAEHVAMRLVPDHVVARIAIVLGIPLNGKENVFLAKLVQNLQDGNPQSLPSDEIRTPIDVVSLAEALIELAGSDYRGILHLGGPTRQSRYQTGQVIARVTGHSEELVQPTDSSALAGRARRPVDVSFDTTKAQSLLKTPLPEIDAAVRKALDHASRLNSRG